MKVSYEQLKNLIPALSWRVEELADKLSAIGFEAEMVGDDAVAVTLTSNRKDCQDIKYLAFDLAGVYGLETTLNLVPVQPGQAVAVTTDQLNRLLGANISFEDVLKLKRLGFAVTPTSVTPPAFRDVATIADVAEEVVRILGFDKLVIQPLHKEKAPVSAEFEHLQAVKIALATAGFTETATSSFSSHGHLKLKNPFADDEPFLRESLLDGLLKTLGKNPFLKRAAFFEIGSVFTPGEEAVVGIVIAGYKKAEDLLLAIEKAIGAPANLTAVEDSKAQKLDAKQGRILWGQFSLGDLKPAKVARPAIFDTPLPKFQPISKFPPLVRDITVPKNQENLVELFRQNTSRLLIAELVDEYQDNQTYRLIFQKLDSSFSEADIRTIDDAIQKHFFKS